MKIIVRPPMPAPPLKQQAKSTSSLSTDFARALARAADDNSQALLGFAQAGLLRTSEPQYPRSTIVEGGETSDDSAPTTPLLSDLADDSYSVGPHSLRNLSDSDQTLLETTPHDEPVLIDKDASVLRSQVRGEGPIKFASDLALRFEESLTPSASMPAARSQGLQQGRQEKIPIPNFTLHETGSGLVVELQNYDLSERDTEAVRSLLAHIAARHGRRLSALKIVDSQRSIPMRKAKNNGDDTD